MNNSYLMEVLIKNKREAKEYLIKKPVKFTPAQAPQVGLEPTTLWLTARCSNQLSY